jgi:hypothetical protein
VDNFFIVITPERPGMIFRKALKASFAPGFFASFLMPGGTFGLASQACGAGGRELNLPPLELNAG